MYNDGAWKSVEYKCRPKGSIGTKIVYVTEEHICTGENGTQGRTLKSGEAVCMYCNIKFVLKKDD